MEDITEGSSASLLIGIPVWSTFVLTWHSWIADIISTVEFDHTGNYLATGDKGGRVVLFERNETVSLVPSLGDGPWSLQRHKNLDISELNFNRRRHVNTSFTPSFNRTNPNSTI